MEASVHELSDLAHNTSELYHELHALDRFEQDYHKKFHEEKTLRGARKGKKCQVRCCDFGKQPSSEEGYLGAATDIGKLCIKKKGELKSHICITVLYQWTWYMHLLYYKSHIPLPKGICAAISKHMSKKDVTHVHQHEQQEEWLQGGVTAARNSDTPVQFRRMLNGGLRSSLLMSSIMNRQNLSSLPHPIRDVCTCLFLSCSPFPVSANLLLLLLISFPHSIQQRHLSIRAPILSD